MGRYFTMHYIPRDRVDEADLSTDLHVVETTLKGLKITTFTLQKLPIEREIEYNIIK